jgi:hypothetical protein
VNLVQILLPAYDNRGRRFPARVFREVREHLTERFGGLTAYTRAPAKGLWRQGRKVVHDDIIVFEVMTRRIDRRWWRRYRQALQKRFKQQVIVVRAQKVEVL